MVEDDLALAGLIGLVALLGLLVEWDRRRRGAPPAEVTSQGVAIGGRVTASHLEGDVRVIDAVEVDGVRVAPARVTVEPVGHSHGLSGDGVHWHHHPPADGDETMWRHPYPLARAHPRHPDLEDGPAWPLTLP